MAFIHGTPFSDIITGTDQADDIFGSFGNDTLRGGGGGDRLDGGAGNDTATYDDSIAGVTVDLMTGTGSGGTAAGDLLFSIENVHGSSHYDVLMGDGAGNRLRGLDGQDILEGRGGADRLEGGADHDIALYTSSAAAVFVSLITNTGAYGDAEGDTFDSIESVGGSAFNDNLWGDDGFNQLFGGFGDDSLKGYGGADSLSGEDGQDKLYGMAGDDHLGGGPGADTLDGGNGIDSLDGGEGADWMSGGLDGDIYVVDTAADVVIEYGGQGFDQVLALATYALAAGADIEVLASLFQSDMRSFDLVGNEFSQTIIGNAGQN